MQFMTPVLISSYFKIISVDEKKGDFISTKERNEDEYGKVDFIRFMPCRHPSLAATRDLMRSSLMHIRIIVLTWTLAIKARLKT